MESKIIDMLLEIKSDIGGLRKGQVEVKDSIDRLDGRACRVEDEIAEIRSDLSEVRITVKALSEALISTSKEVKQLKVRQ